MKPEDFRLEKKKKKESVKNNGIEQLDNDSANGHLWENFSLCIKIANLLNQSI